MRLGGAGAAALILGLGPYAGGVAARPRFSGYPFTLGVASGDPRPDGVALWTRLAPEPLARRGGMPEEAVGVRYEVATDEALRNVVRRGERMARPELAHSVHVELEGLQPNRVYFYRFAAGGYTSDESGGPGRTKTAPARLAFAVASC